MIPWRISGCSSKTKIRVLTGFFSAMDMPVRCAKCGFCHLSGAYVKHRRRRLAQTPLQSAWAIDEFAWNFKSLGQMRSQRFHTEDLRGVMSTEQKIHAELFSGNSRPVRSFASDKGVDVFLANPVNFRACATCHNADHARLLRAEIEDLNRAIQCCSQFTNEFATRHRRAHFQAGRLAFFLQKWLRRF